MSDDNNITLIASIAPVQTAININGTYEGLRIKLDIPETNLLDALRLLAVRETPLEVTIRPLAKIPTDATQEKTKTTY